VVVGEFFCLRGFLEAGGGRETVWLKGASEKYIVRFNQIIVNNLIFYFILGKMKFLYKTRRNSQKDVEYLWQVVEVITI